MGNIRIYLVVIYLFHTIWGLKHLNFIGYKKIYPDVAHFQAYFANFGAFWPFEPPWGAPGDSRPILVSLYVYCVVLVVIYLFQAIWGLKHLDFSGYYKILPDIAQLERSFC